MTLQTYVTVKYNVRVIDVINVLTTSLKSRSHRDNEMSRSHDFTRRHWRRHVAAVTTMMTLLSIDAVSV